MNYISSLNYASYSPTADGSGSLTIQTDFGHIHFTLSKDDISELRDLAFRIFERRQEKIAQAVVAVPTVQAIPFDSAKTIDDEIPF